MRSALLYHKSRNFASDCKGLKRLEAPGSLNLLQYCCLRLVWRVSISWLQAPKRPQLLLAFCQLCQRSIDLLSMAYLGARCEFLDAANYALVALAPRAPSSPVHLHIAARALVAGLDAPAVAAMVRFRAFRVFGSKHTGRLQW